MQLRKPKKTVQPAWRPNFRSQEGLPDIKIIRTDFLLNLGTLAVAVLLLGYYAFTEYNIQSLSGSLTTVEESIAAGVRDNRLALQQHAEFERLAKPLRELQLFKELPYDTAALLNELTLLQPDDTVLVGLHFDPVITEKGKLKEVSYRLRVQGTALDLPDKPATDAITGYRDQLGQMPSIAPVVQDTQLTQFTRDDKLGIFQFTIELSIQPEKDRS